MIDSKVLLLLWLFSAQLVSEVVVSGQYGRSWMVVVVAFSSLARIFGECSTIIPRLRRRSQILRLKKSRVVFSLKLNPHRCLLMC